MEHLDDSMDVFTSLLKASDECIEMMSTDVMRAAIAFKWQAFGRTMWLEQLVVFVIFFSRHSWPSHLYSGCTTFPMAWNIA